MWPLLSFVIILLLIVLYLETRPKSVPSIPKATPSFPILGNSISFQKDPVRYLQSQWALHGNIFLVDLMVLRIIFVLGPEGTNSIFKGTEGSGISLYAAAGEFFSETAEYCTRPPSSYLIDIKSKKCLDGSKQPLLFSAKFFQIRNVCKISHN